MDEVAEAILARGDDLRKRHITILSAGGNAPVQIEGSVKGKNFYFRARGDKWSINIEKYPLGYPEWKTVEHYGEWPDAGFMTFSIALDFLIVSVDKWLDQRVPPRGPKKKKRPL